MTSEPTTPPPGSLPGSQANGLRPLAWVGRQPTDDDALVELSVVVVALNSQAMTLRCLKAASEALAGLPAEVWLVDNGSLDGTPEAVAADFPTVKVITNDRNLGFAAANNQALRQAHGRYWLLLNTDTLLTAEALQAMVRYLDGHPRAAMVGPQLVDERGRFRNSVHSFPSLATELLNRSLLRFSRNH